MVLIQGDLAPSCSEIFGNFRDIFGCHNWAEGVLFLAFGGEKPEMLPYNTQEAHSTENPLT